MISLPVLHSFFQYRDIARAGARRAYKRRQNSVKGTSLFSDKPRNSLCSGSSSIEIKNTSLQINFNLSLYTNSYEKDHHHQRPQSEFAGQARTFRIRLGNV